MVVNKNRYQELLKVINKASNVDLTDNIFNLYNEWIELCRRVNAKPASYVYTDPLNKIYAVRFDANNSSSDAIAVTFYMDEYDKEDGCVSVEYSLDGENVNLYHNELEIYLKNVIKELKIDE